MSSIERVIAAIMIMAISATVALAEMPEELKGTWILNAEATQGFMKTSPKWKAEDDKYLPTILKRMSQMLYSFTDDSVVVSMRGKKQALPVSLKQSDPKKYVLEGTVGDRFITLTVSFVDDATISIRSSQTNDMDYYLWKRGTLTDKKGGSDEILAVEVMKKAMEKPSNKPDASDSK